MQQFYMPTRVILGDHCLTENRELLRPLGTLALIVTGKHASKQNGSLADVTAALEANGQRWAIFDEVMSNPTIACVYQGAAYAREVGADFVIAVGGGSPMDAAKAIALLARQDIAEENLFTSTYTSDVLPLVHIPTTSGTGSEVTQYAILTNDRAQTKSSLTSPYLFPRFAFLDARYTDDMPYTTTIHTAIDALSHAIEGRLSIRANTLTDALALESMHIISTCFCPMETRSLTHEHRQKLMYASTLAGMVIANTGTTSVHSMGYMLTYFHQIDHGRANGLLLPAFLDFIAQTREDLVREILHDMGLGDTVVFAQILDALLGEHDAIEAAELDTFTSLAMRANSRKNAVSIPEEEDIRTIYQKSLRLI